MVDINQATIDRVANEVGTDVDVLHSGMQLRVVRAGDGALVVAVQRGGLVLWVTKFVEEGPEPEDLAGTVRASEVFGLAG